MSRNLLGRVLWLGAIGLCAVIACTESSDVGDGAGGGTSDSGGAAGSTGGQGGSSGAEEGGSGASTADGGSGGSPATCEIKALSDACLSCVEAHCEADCVECSAASACPKLIQCFAGCGDDDDCFAACKTMHPQATGYFGALGRCAGPHCAEECPLFEGMGGMAGAAGASGGAGAAGASGTGGTGGSTGGTGGSTGGTGGSTGGTGGSTGGTGGSTGGTGGSTGGTGGGPTCGASFLSGACGVCVDTYCLSDCSSCVSNVQCSLLFECILTCNGSGGCIATCQNTYAAGQTLFDPVNLCLQQYCYGSCTI